MRKVFLTIVSLCIISSSIFFVACTSKEGSLNNKELKNAPSENYKYENKDLKEFVEKNYDLIKQEEVIYEQMIEAMKNKDKIDTYEKINYNYSVVGEELNKLHESAKSKDFYALAKLYIDNSTAYSYSMSMAVVYISLKGNNNWKESLEDELNNSINKVQSNKDVYYLSKDRMLQEVIYEKND